MPSESSSPDGCIAHGGPDCICDDRCTCGHKRKKHTDFGCNKCFARRAPASIRAHAFELETIEDWPCGDCGATVPGGLDWCPKCFVPELPASCDGGCTIYTKPPCDSADCICGGEWWLHGCKHSLPPEEGPPCSEVEGCDGECCKKAPGPEDPHPYDCPLCDANQAAFEAQQAAEAAKPPQMPRRPPYAVAYVIEGGHLYEVALPGDARITAEDGVLKISHPTGAVLALVQAGPMEVADAADAQE